MKYPLEELLEIADNRYALVEILSQRSRQLRKADESILISTAIDIALDELLDKKLNFYKYTE